MKKALEIARFPTIIIVAFVLLRQVVNDCVAKVIVTPILSRIEFLGHRFHQILFAALIVWLIIYAYSKCADTFNYSKHRLTLATTLCLLYVLARFDGRWKFTDWVVPFDLPIKALDSIVFIVLLSLIVLIWRSFLNPHRRTINPQLGFERDEPITIQKIDDADNRWRYAATIAELLQNTATAEGAFAIGITGEWGSGKTSFIRTLELQLRGDEELIHLHFNPWLISDAKGITESFFSDFSYQLSQLTDVLTGDLSEYVQIITAEKEKGTIVRLLKNFFPSLRWSRTGIEELRAKINSSLTRVAKRFIVYIDDLDRLDDEEITEVLRIIRNSGDFANIIFIVAYDKAQINSALTSKFNHGSTRYLEKVFQYEFHLPPIKRSNLLEKLNNLIVSILTDLDKEALLAMFDKQRFRSTYLFLQEYLKNYRDVVRLTNLFKVHYLHLKNQIFLPDLYLIMLLRLKYPTVVTMLYEDRNRLLTQFGDDFFEKVGKETKFIELERDGNHSSKSILEQRIADPKWKYDDDQKREILSIVSELFRPVISGTLLHLHNDVPNSAYTIRDPDHFDRYFNEDLISRLSIVDFQNAFTKSKNEFLTQVKSWIQNARIGQDLVNILERTTRFESSEDFDKVVSALALIDDCPKEATEMATYARIDERKLVERVALERDHSKVTPTAKLFGGFQAFQEYLRAFLKEDMSYGNVRFRITKAMAEEGYAEFATLLPHEARLLIKSEVFEKMLSDGGNLDDLFALQGFLEMYATEDEEKAELKKAVQNFILKKDLEGFMKWIPKPCSNGGFEIDNFADKYFGESILDFVNLVDRTNLSIAAKEGIAFVEKHCAQTIPRKCTDFDFKELPVRLLNGGWSKQHRKG